MKYKPMTEAEAAGKLHQAIVRAKGGESSQQQDPEDLTCEQVQALLPAFIDAERAGVDVETIPMYAAVLRHFDRCPDCLDLYAALSESLDAIEGISLEPLADPTSSPAFVLARQSEKIKLYVMQGLQRCFAMVVPMPKLGPGVKVMGSGDRLSLFTDTLQPEEIDSQPFVSAVMYPYGEPPTLLVAVREQHGRYPWRVQLQLGELSYSAQTNEQGVARLTGFSEEQLRSAKQMSIICTQEHEA